MTQPNLLILGGSGFVGGWLAETARRRGWTVWLAGRTRPPGWEGGWLQADITDSGQLEAALSSAAPAALVNAAAVADVDLAEREPDLAWRVNVTGAEMAARECARRGVRQVFFSSDAVFSGRELSYREEDAPQPVNHYGRTKAAAEAAVRAADPQAAVLRVSLILGFLRLGGSSYLQGLDGKLARGETVYADPSEVRSPVAVQNLAASVLELLERPRPGFLHLGSTQSANRLELARRLASALGYPPEQVQPPSGPPPASRAPRHQRGVLDVSLARQVLQTPQLDLDETITLAASGRKEKE